MKQEYYNRLASDKIKTEVNKEFNLIDTLKIEQELLVEKIAKTRDKGDYGTYKNLIVALRDITRLIHDEEFFKVRNQKML